MNGNVDYLLDTNVILAITMKSPQAAAFQSILSNPDNRFGYSVITRIELLGYPSITPAEESEFIQMFSRMHEINLHSMVAESAIRIRRARKIKLPDAVILGTAFSSDAQLLTFDADLQSAYNTLKPQFNIGRNKP